jgi:hypothetical protein
MVMDSLLFLKQNVESIGLDPLSCKSLHGFADLVIPQVTLGAEGDKVFRMTVLLNVIDVSDCQSSFVGIERLPGKATLQAALLALPTSCLFDR